MSENKNESIKRKVPILSFKEFLEMEKGNKKVTGPFKFKAEDAEKALEYFKKR